MELKEKDDDKNRVLWTQQEINEMFLDSIKTRDDFIYALLEEKKQIRDLYVKTVTNIIKWVMIPLALVMIISILSYFFGDYTQYSNYERNKREACSYSNGIKKDEIFDANILSIK